MTDDCKYSVLESSACFNAGLKAPYGYSSYQRLYSEMASIYCTFICALVNINIQTMVQFLFLFKIPIEISINRN